MDNDAALIRLAVDHGTSPELARQYNGGSPADREQIAQGVGAALDWSATATPVQLAAQRKTAEKANAYRMAGKAKALGVDFTEFGGLSAYETEAFFNGAPETRQVIAGKLNAAIQPWGSPNEAPTSNAYVPTLADARARIESGQATKLGGHVGDASKTDAASHVRTRPGDGSFQERLIRKINNDLQVSDPIDILEQFLRRYTPTRYGNFGGRNWTNGKFDPDARVIPTNKFDKYGKNKLEPIDVLDASFMIHDENEIESIRLENEGKINEAKSLRRESDLKLLEELSVLLRRHESGDLRLGIDDSGVDNRTKLLGVEHPVAAKEIMINAMAFFFARAAINAPRGGYSGASRDIMKNTMNFLFRPAAQDMPVTISLQDPNAAP